MPKKPGPKPKVKPDRVFESTPANGKVGPTFELGGETFRCLPEVPGGYLVDIVMAQSADEVIRLAAELSFMRGALIPKDEERFEKVIRSKNPVVSAKTIGEISKWLQGEAYMGRPTKPPSGSPVGR